MIIGEKTYEKCSHSRTAIQNMLNSKLKKDVDQIYNLKALNYTSAISSNDELCNEVVAEWLNSNIADIDKINQKKKISREGSYIIPWHKGKFSETNRIEEIIAKKMYKKNYDCIGTIVEYQVPLRDYRIGKKDTIRKNEKKQVGKIDLLSVNENIIHIIELKEPDSKETMLRCIMEGFTYYKTINKEKLVRNLKDNELLSKDPGEYKLVVTPLVFKNSQPYIEMEELLAGHRNKLKTLIESLSKIVPIIPCYLDGEDESARCYTFKLDSKKAMCQK